MLMVRVLVVLVSLLGSVCFGQVDSISKVLPNLKGTTVTLAGVASGWKDSWKESAPNTFYLTDATASIRVCVWPNVLKDVPPPVVEGLKKKGTPVRFVAEVAVFRDSVELHIKQAGQVGLVTTGAPQGQSAAPQMPPVLRAATPAAGAVPQTR